MTELPWHQAHEAYCNGDKSKPVGDPGCSCRAGSIIRSFAAQLREAEARHTVRENGLLERIARLTEQRIQSDARYAEASATIATLTAQVAGLEKALEPFARKLAFYAGPAEGDEIILIHLGSNVGRTVVSDFYAAKAAYDATERKPTHG